MQNGQPYTEIDLFNITVTEISNVIINMILYVCLSVRLLITHDGCTTGSNTTIQKIDFRKISSRIEFIASFQFSKKKLNFYGKYLGECFFLSFFFANASKIG